MKGGEILNDVQIYHTLRKRPSALFSSSPPPPSHINIILIPRIIIPTTLSRIHYLLGHPHLPSLLATCRRETLLSAHLTGPFVRFGGGLGLRHHRLTRHGAIIPRQQGIDTFDLGLGEKFVAEEAVEEKSSVGPLGCVV